MTSVLLVLAAAWIGARALGQATPDADCPKSEEILDGVKLLCGEVEIVGTVPKAAIPLCGVDGQTDCIATSEFPALEIAELDPEDIALGITIAGVVGTYEYELDSDRVIVCNFDSQQTCRVKDALVALDTRTAEEKILAGFFAGGVPGISVSDEWRRCSTTRDVDCLAHSKYRAISVEFLDACDASSP